VVHACIHNPCALHIHRPGDKLVVDITLDEMVVSRRIVSLRAHDTRMHMHASTHARTHTHIHASKQACTCTHARTHEHTHASKQACTCMHARTHAHTHASKQACTCTHAHTHARKQACTCTHARTHAHTHAHKQACMCTHARTHARTQGDFEAECIVDEWVMGKTEFFLVKYKGYELRIGNGRSDKGDWEPGACVLVDAPSLLATRVRLAHVRTCTHA